MSKHAQLMIIRRLGMEKVGLADSNIMKFGKWCARWEDFLNERTTLISGKTTLIHTDDLGLPRGL